MSAYIPRRVPVKAADATKKHAIHLNDGTDVSSALGVR
jgi:hypothetical protein